ncbi:MAG TPA: TadE family protein, partial [Terriglobales bacterium]|nr:TadE family protein [Terriglobales bacterium]
AVLPLLVFLALAVSDGAGMIRANQILNNAAREAARLSTLKENAGNITFLQNTATCYLIRNGIDPPSGQIPSSRPVTVTTPTCTQLRGNHQSSSADPKRQRLHACIEGNGDLRIQTTFSPSVALVRGCRCGPAGGQG